MKIWLYICFSLYGSSLPLSELKEDPYGFLFVDVGITAEDLENFSSIDIQKERVYHQFGELETTLEIANFFSALGANGRELSLQAASLIHKIVSDVITASGRETAWIYIRAFTPTDQYDTPRWHLDGYYYSPEREDDLIFKFALTLLGPTTLFYLLPEELRKTAETHTRNRQYMKNFCRLENIRSPRMGEGAVFTAGRSSALHSEPPIHENRIFFTVVPCMERELQALKTRVLSVYPKDSRE
jgi:hypothetical protein